MHFFSGLSALAVVGSLLAVVQATGLETCPLTLECCGQPQRRRSLFRRTDNQCQKDCCAEYKSSVKLHTTTTLQCGRKGEKSSSVTVTVEKCPTKDEKCVHVYYANVPGTDYKEAHLQIAAHEITKSAPGQFDFNHYCTTSGKTANCWVPLSVVVKKLFGSDDEKDLCHKTVWIAAHAAISDGNTCWGDGPKIVQKSNNWAMNFKVIFECDEECVKRCCCIP